VSRDEFVAVHHESAGDGTTADRSAIQIHALPMARGTLRDRLIPFQEALAAW
jgi:hypothetical protein